MNVFKVLENVIEQVYHYSPYHKGYSISPRWLTV